MNALDIAPETRWCIALETRYGGLDIALDGACESRWTARLRPPGTALFCSYIDALKTPSTAWIHNGGCSRYFQDSRKARSCRRLS